MKLSKQTLGTIGLIFITIMASIQYIFLRNVPDTVSSFAFVCITNVIGLVILGAIRFKKLFSIKKSAILKGILFAVELTGFNVFLLLGSRKLDAVIISSVVSLYFVFVTPFLLLMRKKVNFFSGIATVIAIISLLLMFGADTDTLFASKEVIYLIIADIFFAAYVVSVSVFGEKEDSTQLTLSQMIFSALFALIGWVIENAVTGQGFFIPTDAKFWVSALFIGVMIRAVYGLVQISAQKYVSALKTSLIFSTEIIITLIANPIVCGILGIGYEPATLFQVAGGILLIIATLMVDERVMTRWGYEDLKEVTYINEKGETVRRGSVAKKVILTTLTFAMITIVLSTITFLTAISYVRVAAVENSKNLGESASYISSEAMMNKLEEIMVSQSRDKALLAEEKLDSYADAASYAAAYADYLYTYPDDFPQREVDIPRKENAGTWTMQRSIANEGIKYENLQKESMLLGNMESAFASIIQNNPNIATIYIAAESGLMVSYDPSSDLADVGGEYYYEFRNSTWYWDARQADGAFFTDPYQDGLGRGLTISVVAPFFDEQGRFYGCVAMDVLLSELNSSMVNDGIVEPSYAMMIDSEGNYIAGKNIDEFAEDMGSVYDVDKDEFLHLVSDEILKKKDGIVSVGEGENAEYISFATIDTTDWTICILSPVSTVIAPALKIRDDIDENTTKVVTSVSEGILKVIQSCLLLSALILLLITFFAGRYSKKISDPLKQLESDVKKISDGNLDSRTEVKTDDEIGSLASSFNIMTDSLQKYIADLKDVTAKEERIASELSVATNIQASMLPMNYDTFSGRSEINLFASMSPAKEVGGDFYDFFMVDEDHVALVMADVSGKGVPAALFMAISKALIKTRAQSGQSPSAILETVNHQLCESNKAEMFVTVWLAIIDVNTGKGLAANAGHEHPVLRRAGGLYQLVEYRHSPAVATFDGLPFREHEFQLYPGDTIFVYTDGVPEATNAENQLFGPDRMLVALNRNPEASPEELIAAVRAEIDSFVGDAPQFDDITMLCMKYKENEKNS